MNSNEVQKINAIESEAGIIATLLHHAEYVFCADDYLLPEHFTDTVNKCIYLAIRNMARNKGVLNADPYNIISYLNSSNATKEFANKITQDKLDELIEVSVNIKRDTPEEYKMLADNVVNAALRHDLFLKLDECQGLCVKGDTDDIQSKVYELVDTSLAGFSAADEVPEYKDVVDGYWSEIQERQGKEYAGIPFKFPTLNQYVTLEPGELVIFAADAKQGKSMMLLNCAVDLLGKGLSVLYLDSELNTRLFTARILSHLSGIEYRKLTTGNYENDEATKIETAIDWLKTRNFTHLYIPTFDLRTIFSAVKRLKHSSAGLDVLIIDYFKGTGNTDAYASYAELGRFVDTVNFAVYCGDTVDYDWAKSVKAKARAMLIPR